MTAARKIPDAVRRTQSQAADPGVSAFVSANAGSGKTHVLAQRVINLLLHGVDPAKILCITFTKAAAANMATRVFETLAGWTALDDAALDAQIRLSTYEKPDAAKRARARRLFASALETPGGLKVQTIHAFCTQLLHQFPFEANVAARFTVLDESSTAQLLDRLTLDVLLQASADENSALGTALAQAITFAADQTFKDVIGEAIRQRDTLQGWIERAGGSDKAIMDLSQSLGLASEDSINQVEREYFSASLIPESEWPALMEMLGTGSANDRRHIAALQAARAAEGDKRFEHYLNVFCTSLGEPRKNILTKKLAERHPEWLERLTAEQARVCALLVRRRALHARDRTAVLINIAAEVIARYEREKERRALMDYDDLIEKTLALFTRASARWVLYKLDLGIDHVLIDEAQDTSPKQWTIIKAICSEFLPGGARDTVKRTIFAVGDEKQSIFSFQGAAPQAFDEMRHHFASQFDNSERGWRYLRFHHSFRSGEMVLGSVDRVFGVREIYQSITSDEAGVPPHEALPDAAPGLVELWPLIEPAEKESDKEGWDAPLDAVSEESPRVKLARRIAAQVKRWTARGLKAGDVLVLVRQRGTLFEAIIRALKSIGVPVAGADRLTLTEHIAVMDLMALADCLLLADDDLALASVLKSPLFGLSEQQLFELAWNRPGSLRDSMHAHSDDEFVLAMEEELENLNTAARNLSPFAFFAHVLGARRGRAKFLARLGPEANDALDEFLNLALDYEAHETPSLQGFLAWLREVKAEVKRDMELARDEVRVMTVHGAKGLESETVILADTVTPPNGPRDPRLLSLTNGAVVWATARSDDVAAITQARTAAHEAARNENRRLLYVAMTRAKQRLVICGARGDKKIPDGCWYRLVEDALKPVCLVESAEDGDGDIWRYRKGPEEIISAKTELARATEKESLPAWLAHNVPVEKPALCAVAPSRLLEGEEMAQPVVFGGVGLARMRGILAHRLLEALPDIPPERRKQAADDYLARADAALSADERKIVAEQVMRVIEDPRFYEIYRPGSRAEVQIVGRVEIGGEMIPVSGRIDRLAVTQNAVLIADFKTNRPAPRRLEEVPPAYVNQLALYRAVLQKLYPQRPVRCALVWTEVPELMELSDETLEAALKANHPRVSVS